MATLRGAARNAAAGVSSWKLPRGQGLVSMLVASSLSPCLAYLGVPPECTEVRMPRESSLQGGFLCTRWPVVGLHLGEFSPGCVSSVSVEPSTTAVDEARALPSRSSEEVETRLEHVAQRCTSALQMPKEF